MQHGSSGIGVLDERHQARAGDAAEVSIPFRLAEGVSRSTRELQRGSRRLERVAEFVPGVAANHPPGSRVVFRTAPHPSDQEGCPSEQIQEKNGELSHGSPRQAWTGPVGCLQLLPVNCLKRRAWTRGRQGTGAPAIALARTPARTAVASSGLSIDAGSLRRPAPETGAPAGVIGASLAARQPACKYDRKLARPGCRPVISLLGNGERAKAGRSPGRAFSKCRPPAPRSSLDSETYLQAGLVDNRGQTNGVGRQARLNRGLKPSPCR